MSLNDIVKSESPQLSVIRKHSGNDYVHQVVYLIINDLVNYFNVGKTMDHQQINETVELIIEEFWMLKPDDFKLCFKNAKRGMYNDGKMYDRIDGQVICSWLYKYADERVRVFMRKNDEAEKKKEQPINYELVKKWQENNPDFMERHKLDDDGYARYKAEMFRQQIEDEQKNQNCEGRGEQ